MSCPGVGITLIFIIDSWLSEVNSRISVSSTMTTASAPSGTGPPVDILTAWPLCKVELIGCKEHN